MSALLKLYLFSYNSLQAIGWTLSRFKLLSNCISTQSVGGAYASAGDLICFLQSLSFLEVIHGALGIVPSGVLFPLMQWGGRAHFLLATVLGINEVRELPAVFITFLAWSLSELVALPLLHFGALISVWLMYQALPYIKEKQLYADYLFGIPFAYYGFVLVVLMIYPFLWLKLYLHMFKQRSSKLGKQQKKKKKT